MKKNSQNKGFSLVEMILVVAISAIIALAVSQIFLSGAKSFEKNKEMEKNVEEGRAAMELMAKNVRMSKYLTNIAGSTAPVTATTTTVYFYNNSQKKCISYKFDNTAKKLQAALLDPDATDPNNPTCNNHVASDYNTAYSDLIPSNATGNFYIISTNRTSNPQKIGRATISITVGTGTGSEQTIQTTVSFRDYDDILQ